MYCYWWHKFYDHTYIWNARSRQILVPVQTSPRKRDAERRRIENFDSMYLGDIFNKGSLLWDRLLLSTFSPFAQGFRKSGAFWWLTLKRSSKNSGVNGLFARAESSYFEIWWNVSLIQRRLWNSKFSERCDSGLCSLSCLMNGSVFDGRRIAIYVLVSSRETASVFIRVCYSAFPVDRKVQNSSL